MKKSNLLLFSAVAGMMLFSSCSKEGVEPQTNDGAQVISLQVSNSGDGLTTRAGRELLSNEALQDIDNVGIYIVDGQNTIVYADEIENWKNVSKDYSISNDGLVDGKELKIVLEASDKLDAGSYTIYAIGHTENSDYNLSAIEGLKKGDTFNSNVVLSYKDGKNVPEEIFAGSKTFDVENKADGFNVSVVLNRQVAGAYVYAYNIPYSEGLNGDCELQLVASDVNNQLILGNFANKDIDNNGNNTGDNVRYVVNGWKSEGFIPSSYVVCSTKLSDWYNEIKAEDNIVDVEGWKSEGHKGYVKGSVFASSFVIPFKKVDGQQTLKLQLVSADGETVYSHWNINLPNTKNRLGYWDGSKFITQDIAESSNTYSIVRNHLYSVGTRTKHFDPDDPNTPEDPTPDPKGDDPQDLSKGQNINVRVNQNWEIINRMELE